MTNAEQLAVLELYRIAAAATATALAADKAIRHKPQLTVVRDEKSGAA